MKRAVIVFLVFALLGLAASASAQTINNPGTALWTASPDHATIDSYEIAWFKQSDGTQVGSTVNLGKPTPDATNTCTASINVQPLAFNTYVAKMRAVAGTVYSEWSDISNPFSRIPGKPGKPAVK